MEKGCASRWFWTWGLGWGCEPQTHVLAAGVSAQSFLHCFSLASAAFNLQVATPGVSPATLLASCWGVGAAFLGQGWECAAFPGGLGVCMELWALQWCGPGWGMAVMCFSL